MDDADPPEVARLPVQYRGPLPDRCIVHPREVGKQSKCGHIFVQYLVDPEMATVECGACGAALNPMWVLNRLAQQDRRLQDALARAKAIDAKLQDRQRTKCQHCKKMTRIKGL